MNDPREADNRKDEKNLFWKDPCSPSFWGKPDYTRAMALVKVTFLLNNLGDRIAEQ